ncbi:MAG: diadenylate cyclase CdaA [Oscillospiraceae bacterium]|nr:diadenylate cyclase CdaA [Oscillospiraceae bacterium]
MNILKYISNIVSTMVIWDFIDILVIAYVIYKIITLMRRSSSAATIKGIVFLVAVLWLSNLLNLNMVNYLLGKTMEWGVIALIIIFHPEIRKFLSNFGNNKLFSAVFGRQASQELMESAINNVVLACESMSASRTGALIVFERYTMLDDYSRHGTVIDASVSPELIKNIFFHNSPLHDGAMIIRNGRIVAAGCMLPMSSNANISKELGMRHRAGIGMSEQTDAVVVIVSEETGAISIAIDGMLKRKIDADTAAKLLKLELLPETDKKSIRDRVKKKLRVNTDGE